MDTNSVRCGSSLLESEGQDGADDREHDGDPDPFKESDSTCVVAQSCGDFVE